jgi:hypothetical protein
MIWAVPIFLLFFLLTFWHRYTSFPTSNERADPSYSNFLNPITTSDYLHFFFLSLSLPVSVQTLAN